VTVKSENVRYCFSLKCATDLLKTLDTDLPLPFWAGEHFLNFKKSPGPPRSNVHTFSYVNWRET